MEGTVTPDYAQVVGISTRSAQKELLPLAIIAAITPLVVGLGASGWKPWVDSWQG